MTERERWIVYPLLFLALGSALRDKLIDQTRSKSIVCQELLVFGEDRGLRQMVPLVRIGAADTGEKGSQPYGAIEVNGIIKSREVYADNYWFRGIPFGPNLLRAVPGMLPADWLRALQQSAEAVQNQRGQNPDAPSETPVPPSNAAPPAAEAPTDDAPTDI